MKIQFVPAAAFRDSDLLFAPDRLLLIDGMEIQSLTSCKNL